MKRMVKVCTEQYKKPSLDLIEKVFTEHENAKEGKLVRQLAAEIRSKEYYVPELELIMVDERDEVIGYAMFSRFHLEGNYSDELLLLSPVAVKTELQRQHISKELIECGLKKAEGLGYKAVLVEGDPRNYHPRGFRRAADYGIYAGENLQLPHIDCLMVQELVPGGLEHIHGIVDYGVYKSLSPSGAEQNP